MGHFDLEKKRERLNYFFKSVLDRKKNKRKTLKHI